MARRRLDAVAPDLEPELMALYAEVDEVYAGFSCPASTECCRFGVTGREPYVTSIELSLVKRAAARVGKPITGPDAVSKRGLPVFSDPSERVGPTTKNHDERPCPMLDGAGHCSVYAHRPLGCRTYYCDRATKASKVRHSQINDFVRRLKDLAARHEPGGEEGRPFVRALGLSGRRTRSG